MLTLDQETLLKQVRRQNRHAERDRLAARDAVETRISDLEIAADACRNTMQRLRGARGKGSDYELALHRRDEVLREIEELKISLDPSTELKKVSLQMDVAAWKQKQQEEIDAEQYVKTAKMVEKTLHPALERYPHPKGWDFDPDTGNVIFRNRTPLPESDMSLLKMEWTRFDYKPKVPWRSAAANELQTVADGLLTYHTKKSDRMERHARASRQRLMTSGSSRGSPRGTSRSSRTGGRGGFEGAGFDANSSFGPRPTSALYTGGTGSPTNGSNDITLNNNTNDGTNTSRPSTRPMSGVGGIILMPVGHSDSSALYPNDVTGTQQEQHPQHPLTLNLTRPGLVNLKKLSPVPSATVKRRQITLRPIPQDFLDSLSPEQLRKPLHPAYLLSSEASHTDPWKKPNPKGKEFSIPPANKAPTANELLRAKQYIVPDRSFYNPRDDGKREFLKPDIHPYPTFSELPANSAWLLLHGREEDKELQKRFYAQIAQNDYQGEDAFNSTSSKSHSMTSKTMTTGAALFNASNVTSSRSPQLTMRDTSRGLPPMPQLSQEVRASSRERLHTNHPLGAKAVEAAALEHTTRILGGERPTRAHGPTTLSNKFETKMLPSTLF